MHLIRVLIPANSLQSPWVEGKYKCTAFKKRGSEGDPWRDGVCGARNRFGLFGLFGVSKWRPQESTTIGRLVLLFPSINIATGKCRKVWGKCGLCMHDFPFSVRKHMGNGFCRCCQSRKFAQSLEFHVQIQSRKDPRGSTKVTTPHRDRCILSISARFLSSFVLRAPSVKIVPTLPSGRWPM